MAWTVPNEADAAFADQAEYDKVDWDVIVTGLAGNGVRNDGNLCAVTAQGTPDMTVAVASGTVVIDGVAVAVGAGNVTITAADATNPRFDLVVVSNAGAKSVTAGTPSTNPVFPAIPANSIVLAAVYVPANDTTIETDHIIDKRVILSTIVNAHVDAAAAIAESKLALSYATHPKAHDHTTGDGSGVMTNDEHDGYSQMAAIAEPSAPSAGFVRLYAKSVGSGTRLFFKDSVLGTDDVMIRPNRRQIIMTLKDALTGADIKGSMPDWGDGTFTPASFYVACDTVITGSTRVYDLQRDGVTIATVTMSVGAQISSIDTTFAGTYTLSTGHRYSVIRTDAGAGTDGGTFVAFVVEDVTVT